MLFERTWREATGGKFAGVGGAASARRRDVLWHGGHECAKSEGHLWSAAAGLLVSARFAFFYLTWRLFSGLLARAVVRHTIA